MAVDADGGRRVATARRGDGRVYNWRTAPSPLRRRRALQGADSFNYTITDQDGDTSTATVTVTVAADSVPSVVSTTNLTVDEDGFAAAPIDTVTARTDETDSTESLTASGTAVVNFGNDVPANLLASIVLVDTAALDGQLQTLDGQSVTFALDRHGDLVGTVGAGATRGHPHPSGERGCRVLARAM